MSQSRLIEVSYYDSGKKVRLSAYADTIILDRSIDGSMICAIRFGGYPELVRGLSDAIYGGGGVDLSFPDGSSRHVQSMVKAYQRQMNHDGAYAIATLIIKDDGQTEDQEEEEQEGGDRSEHPRRCYIFSQRGDRQKLFQELDAKTAAPLIPEFQDYVLNTLITRKDLKKLEVVSTRNEMDAWVLCLKPHDANVIEVLEQGLRSGQIVIPGAAPDLPDGFDGINTVTDYLKAFGVTVADRIRNQFEPLFDPAEEPLSDEILAINEYIMEHAGYSLYDAQLAEAEANMRQLQRKKAALIVAECGSGKTKIGAMALSAAQAKKGGKAFNVILAPSHVTKKWVREIAETLPNTYAMVVKNITELRRLYDLYEQGQSHVYAVISKERARDGYMRYPAVLWNRHRKAFLCPHCMKPIQIELTDDGIRYMVNADQFFFQTENKRNHICPNPECGEVLWSAVNPERKMEWVKIGEYGWIHRSHAAQHLERTKNEKVREQILAVVDDPDGHFPVRGAVRRYPLSTYIKKKMRGKISGFLCDELHEYNNAIGQGDAMSEIYGTSKKFIGMTATLINGYSSGIFHLLYRIVPGLMLKDGKRYQQPGMFDAEYGVVETVYEISDADYNSNRRTNKSKRKTKQLPGVSPLVFSRFLLEYASFLTLSDMGKDLPDYEEIPVPLKMPPDVYTAYKTAERVLQRVLRTDRKIAQKILSAYLGLLTVYPDQPYDQPSVVHPITGEDLVVPEDRGDFDRILLKEEKVLEIVRAKIAAGERVLVYTSWTRTDSQRKIVHLLQQEGIYTEILKPTVPPEKREEWVERRVKNGLQVLITNPRCVETGLDLNAFTTLIFYSMGYNLFTFRQASRRSWRINQRAPRVEVYMFYYMDTMQAKAMKLMASKLAVAGIIEGNLSEEGLAAMSDVKDLTSQMAKELAQGIKDNVEDIASAFKKMAIINPERHRKQEEQKKAEVIDVAFVEVEEKHEKSVPVVAEMVESISTREADARARQELYEGLLARTIEEKKKRRSKKEVVDVNQLSLFDFAA